MSLSYDQNTSLTIPPFIGQDVKEEESTSVKLPPSNLYLKENSATKNLLSLLFKSNLLRCDQTNDPLTLPWLQLMARPLDLSKFNADAESLVAKERNRLNRELNILPVQKVEVQCKCEAETNDNSLIVKKEEEETPKEPTEVAKKRKRNSKLDESPKKKAQNRIKNFPGLVVQRVKSSIKTFRSLKPQEAEKLESRFQYIAKWLNTMTKSEINAFLSFLDVYEKKWKTWNTIQNFLNRDRKFGRILLDIVDEFFGEGGKEDFVDWLKSGKMGEKSKDTVMSMKEHIGNKFKLIVLAGEDEEQMASRKKNV